MTAFNQTRRQLSHLPDTRSVVIRYLPHVLVGCIGLMAVLIVVHIGVGTIDMTIRQIVLALLNQPEEVLHRQVVWELRLPRALIALVAGAMLGLSGAILQTVTRNPLAAPGLIGVTQGGVLAIVAYIVLASRSMGFGTTIPDAGLVLPFVALIGGLGAALLTYVLSYSNGSDPMRLVLVGVLVGAVCSALTSALLLSGGDEAYLGIMRWIIGSTGGRLWDHWNTLWPIAVIAIPLGIASAGLANALQLGDGVARGLGLRVEYARVALLFVAALLTAGAVSTVGAIGFVGLIGPHITRQLVGSDVRRLFPLSAALTGLLLISADIVARTAELDLLVNLFNMDPSFGGGVPVGAVTALLGAPFFLYLLLRPGSEL